MTKITINAHGTVVEIEDHKVSARALAAIAQERWLETHAATPPRPQVGFRVESPPATP